MTDQRAEWQPITDAHKPGDPMIVGWWGVHVDGRHWFTGRGPWKDGAWQTDLGWFSHATHALTNIPDQPPDPIP